MRLRLDGLAELPATAARASPFAKTPRLTPLFQLLSSNYSFLSQPTPPSPALVLVSLSCLTGSYSLIQLYPQCPYPDPSPLAHPYPVIFHPLLLSPVVFHNNTPLPFLPPPPTARQAYLIPQPSSNQPTSLLVPQINNTD